MSGMHSGFGELDLDLGNLSCDDDDEAPATIPTPGSAQLKIEDKEEALFTSCEWTVVATVIAPSNKLELGRSTTIKKAHTAPYVKRWARQLIRQNKARLVRLGVDVPATYLQWGGILEDLDD
jgi:hypothetical protein